MPLDLDLLDRVRTALAGTEGLCERRMFGGVVFMLNGAMLTGVDKSDLIIRCGVDRARVALTEPHVRAFDLGAKPMKGWLLVSAEGTRTDAQMRNWLDAALAFNRQLQNAKR